MILLRWAHTEKIQSESVSYAASPSVLCHATGALRDKKETECVSVWRVFFFTLFCNLIAFINF